MVRAGGLESLVVRSILVAFSCTLVACTSIQVWEADPSLNIKNVCIESNPKVLVTDFLDVLREGFLRHGISTEVYDGAPPSHCRYWLAYTALRSWDIAPYLSVADLWLYRGDELVARAKYHLKGKGGFALTKFQGTRKKMDPVIDQLLKGYPPSQ